MKKSAEENRDEALSAIVNHYGLPHFMELVDVIVDRIAKEVMSVPLPQGDPERAALALYSKRMQAEGAQALRNALVGKVSALKERVRENK